MFKTRRFLAAILVLWLFAVGCGAQSAPVDPINWGTPQEESFKDEGARPMPWGFIQACSDPKNEIYGDEDCLRFRGEIKK